MSKQVILGLSGPPRAGKDTVASLIQAQSRTPSAIRRMSQPLKSIALMYIPIKDRRDIEEKKDAPLPNSSPSRHVSYRQLQIDAFHFGEERMGKDWLGRHLLEALQFCHSPLVLIPDFGRLEEVEVLLSAGLCVRQLKIYRPGTSFAGDSRVDFTLPNPSHSWILINGGDLEDLSREVKNALSWLSNSLLLESTEGERV